MLVVVRCIDEHEETSGRDYGASRGDFHASFRDLYWHTINADIHRDIDEVLGETTLKDWAGIILHFQDVWFNDEGEYWNDVPEEEDWPEDKKGLVSWTDAEGMEHARSVRSYLMDELMIKASLSFDRQLRELFKYGNPGRDELIEFFSRSDYAGKITFYWSRQGFLK